MAAVQGGLPPPPPPVSGAGPSGSAPSSDRKRQQERRPSQSARPASAEKRSRPAEPSSRLLPPPSNWLRRETPFICDIRFANNLPEVPCEPKLLVTPLDPQQLARFRLTSLERDPKRDLVLEPDLGIPLSVFDIGRYDVPAVTPLLAPEDAALLEGDDDVAVETTSSSPAVRVRQRLKGDKAELSWLMRTTYISNDGDKLAAKGVREKEAKIARELQSGPRPPEDPVAHQLQEIEAGFEAAQQPPVHHKNRGLHAVEVLEVLPDAELWPNEYVQVVFDSDPTAEVPHLRGKPADARRAAAETAVAKPFKMSAEGQADYSFLAYMLPAAAAAPEPQAADSPSGEETEMQWVREYDYAMRSSQNDQDFVFMFGGDGRVTYVDMNYRLTTQRARKGSSRLSQSFPKPSRVTVKRRAHSEGEQADRAKRVHVLNTGFDPDEEGLFDDDDGEQPGAEDAGRSATEAADTPLAEADGGSGGAAAVAEDATAAALRELEGDDDDD